MLNLSSQNWTGFKVAIEDQIAIVHLDNPPANTWTVESLQALKQFVLQCNQERKINALIITGQGPKFFSAGADLKLFAEKDPSIAFAMATAFGEAFETLSHFKGVSIAAINGYAMGGGLECALACDIRIVEEHAKMALPEASVGLLPCAGGTQWLPWLVGEGWAKRMILCGEQVNAETAKTIGLVEEVVPTGQSLNQALELAKKVGRQSPDAILACKSLIQSSRFQAPNYNLIKERDAFTALFYGSNQQEGVQAFLNKQLPKWQY